MTLGGSDDADLPQHQDMDALDDTLERCLNVRNETQNNDTNSLVLNLIPVHICSTYEKILRQAVVDALPDTGLATLWAKHLVGRTRIRPDILRNL